MKKYSLLSFLVIVSISGFAQELRASLNYNTADIVVKGCIDYAGKNNLKMAIAVYDAGGTLVSFAKMDGTSAVTGEVAQWKGLSAAKYQFPTSETSKWNVPTAPDIATAAGGLPIKAKDGSFIGGVGVSGAASSVDVQCAVAGLKNAGLYVEDEAKK
jgi:glc operon protein GlcG